MEGSCLSDTVQRTPSMITEGTKEEEDPTRPAGVAVGGRGSEHGEAIFS